MKLGLPNPATIIANRLGNTIEEREAIKNKVEKVALVVAVIGLAAIGSGIASIFLLTLPFHWPVSLIVGGAIAGGLGAYTAVGSEKAELSQPQFDDLRPRHIRFAEWLGLSTIQTKDF